jgi:hypothetical protein
MSDVKKSKKSFSSSVRSDRRFRDFIRITIFDLSFKSCCDRCDLLNLVCYSLLDERCFECIIASMKKNCDSQVESKIDKTLRRQKIALFVIMTKTIVAAFKTAQTQTKTARIFQTVKSLKNRSRKKLNEIMKKIEKENESEESFESSSENTESDEAFDDEISTSDSSAEREEEENR